jgi:Amt family ammonium transporter
MTGSRAAEKGTASQLIGALRSDQFILYCQPIKPISAGADQTGFQEILIRFLEEEEKLLPPGSFFPILESCNLMAVLDQWVIKRVIRWIDATRRTLPARDAPRCSINLSSDSISSAGFSKFVKEQLQSSDVSAATLAFEVPETDAAMHTASLEILIGELRPLGCGFTLTGYSGDFVPAELLETLGIDLVKIDAHAMSRASENTGGADKMKTTLRMCRTLGIRTIAEFVEQPETLETLKALGVDYAQGYGVGKPQRLT